MKQEEKALHGVDMDMANVCRSPQPEISSQPCEQEHNQSDRGNAGRESPESEDLPKQVELESSCYLRPNYTVDVQGRDTIPLHDAGVDSLFRVLYNNSHDATTSHTSGFPQSSVVHARFRQDHAITPQKLVIERTPSYYRNALSSTSHLLDDLEELQLRKRLRLNEEDDIHEMDPFTHALFSSPLDRSPSRDVHMEFCSFPFSTSSCATTGLQDPAFLHDPIQVLSSSPRSKRVNATSFTLPSCNLSPKYHFFDG